MSISISCPDCGKTFKNIKPELQGKKARCRCGKVIRLGAPKKSKQPVPSVEVHSNSKADAPMVMDTFGDLDDILESEGTAAPLVLPAQTAPRPGANPITQPSSVVVEQKSKRPSGFGLLVALISGTLAIWFGAFLVLSRFQVVNQLGLGWFSKQIRSGYSAVFDLAQVPERLQLTFVSLGWVLWSVGLVMMFLGVLQIVNALLQLVFQKRMFRWADGLVAGAGVAAVFVFVCLIFSQTTLNRALHRSIADQTEPRVEFGMIVEPHENVTRIQSEFDGIARDFNWSMYSGIGLAGTLFSLSMVRLFANVGTD